MVLYELSYTGENRPIDKFQLTTRLWLTEGDKEVPYTHDLRQLLEESSYKLFPFVK